MKRFYLYTFVVVVVSAVAYGVWHFNGTASAIVISGVIEADDIHVGSKIGGRVLKVVAKEGQTVKGGESLVLLEPNEMNAALAQAQAELRQAQAKYALMTAGSRSEEIEQAEAAAKQAQAELDQLISGPR
ncbi:MAG: biotin/lipoyl-binding protein [Deltaproteobacteria bacterium]|nr:biotin/lipoyl-binding protein [Deltaproteobacteria bacterium]